MRPHLQDINTDQPGTTTGAINRLNAIRQENEMVSARQKLLGIPETELGVLPKWFPGVLRDAIERGVLKRPLHGMLNGLAGLACATERFGKTWLDHYGRAILPDGSQVFVSEPYGLVSGQIRELEEFCNGLKLDYTIRSEAWWNLGTVRIELLPAVKHSQSSPSKAESGGR